MNKDKDFEKSLRDYVNITENEDCINVDTISSRSDFEISIDRLRESLMSNNCNIQRVYNSNVVEFIRLCKEWFDCYIDEEIIAAVKANRIDVLERLVGRKCDSVMELYKSAVVQNWNVSEMYESSVTNDSEMFIQNFIPELAQYTGKVFYISKAEAMTIEGIKEKIMSMVEHEIEYGGNCDA